MFKIKLSIKVSSSVIMFIYIVINIFSLPLINNFIKQLNIGELIFLTLKNFMSKNNELTTISRTQPRIPFIIR